ncbi:MAG: helix-turn-helix transcriptional regulator [Alphaproteobacteria bacterium]|nr:helix-turn-helix transcriptional regulator [Alphaproteobacteria bacterium]
MDTATIASRLEALGNETRLEMYRLLVRAGRDGLPVGELQRRTGAARSTLSHHLHKLIAVGLVYQQRDGTTLHCHADYAVMDGTLTFLTRECCVDGRRAADDCPGETRGDAGRAHNAA